AGVLLLGFRAHVASLRPYVQQHSMNYDPIKDRLGSLFNRRPWLQRLFFVLLEIFFLRTWYVKRELKKMVAQESGKARVLDAGTGFGQYSWWMARNWPELDILAVDVKADYLDE